MAGTVQQAEAVPAVARLNGHAQPGVGADLDGTVAWRLNGQGVVGRLGQSLLEAVRAAGVDLPTLCHDPRLKPASQCRLCEVEVAGEPRPLCACATALKAGMEVRTHTPELEAFRKDMLRLLAKERGRDAVARDPDKPFHALLARYGLVDRLPERHVPEPEPGPRHPYIAVDMGLCVHCDRCVRICAEVQGQFIWKAAHRGTRRRIVAEADQALMETACVSCGACVDTCPSGALEDRRVLEQGRAERWTRTTCPYCGVGCELDVGTREGRIVTVKPSLQGLANRGHLCVKGRFGLGYVEAPDRVLHPMVRRAGAWMRVSWDEALDAAAAALRGALEGGGPEAVAVLASSRATNEACYMAQKLARVVLGTHSVDCCARVCHAPSAAGLGQAFGTGAATSAFDDIERAGLLLVTGSNATENHPVVGARIKQRALAGIPLIVIDPRRTELARHAAVHLQLRPGTNVPLFSALAHVILAEGLEDRAFLVARTEGLEAFCASVAPWTPEAAGVVCGVDPELIRAAARRYATTRPALALNGLGMTEQAQGTDGIIALAQLALLTGNVGRPGSGVNPLRGQNNVQGSANMGCEPTRLTGYQKIEAVRGLHESVWGQPLPTNTGVDAVTMVDAAMAGTLRSVLLIGYDVLLSHPDMHATEAALGRLKDLVVVDLFLNESAKAFGTVFLPAASSFEVEGTFMSGERRIQRVRPALPPAGESKDDREILRLLAARLGREDALAFDTAEDAWNEVRRVWPAVAGITYARLEAGGLQWPCPDEAHPGTAVLHGTSFPFGARATFKALEHRPSLEVPDGDFPLLLNTGRMREHFNAHTMTARTRNRELAPDDRLEVHPSDAARLGIATGGAVEVESRHGRFVAHALVTDRVRPGELFAVFHRAEAQVNRVTGKGRDPVTHTPEFKVTAVRIRPLGA